MVDVIIKEIINKGTLTYVIATDVNGENQVRLNFNTDSFLSMTDREVEMCVEQSVESEMRARAMMASLDGMVNPIEEKIERLKAKNAQRVKELASIKKMEE